MKVYIRQNEDGQFATIECGLAYHGFKRMGWEINPYQSFDAIEDFQPQSLIVSGIPDIYEALASLGIDRPKPLDYPIELYPFLGRKVWRSTIDDLAASKEWQVFIKPVNYAET